MNAKLGISRMVPKYVFLTKGIGCYWDRVGSFELALRAARIQHVNLVPVSSIYPPNCEIIPRAKGCLMLKAGEITYCVMARAQTNIPGRLLAAAVSIAVPTKCSPYGYIWEYHCYDGDVAQARQRASQIALDMLHTALDSPSGPKHSDRKKTVCRLKRESAKCHNIVQKGEGSAQGGWTTCVAAAVFVSTQEKH